MPFFSRPAFQLNLGKHRLSLGAETKLMGILNITPDSFSDGGLYKDPGRAEEQALRLEAQGAHILDIGGESSRPGSRAVSPKEEMSRISPALKRLARKIKIPISVDTYKYEVAAFALDNGACLINDIYGLRSNMRLAKLIARKKAGVVLMHMQGSPRTMQKRPKYKNLLQEVSDYLYNAIGFALDSGISESSIVIDPGFGFGKTAVQNIELLNGLQRFQSLRLPVLAGLSRKSFIGYATNELVQNRLAGTLAAGSVAILQGAHILRVHDIAPHKQMARFLDGALIKE